MHTDARYTLYGGTVIGGALVTLGAITSPVIVDVGGGIAGAGLALALAFDHALDE